ncbi:hypothetical protein [Puia dinghuensis]|uniref:Uncharacterized protein n=1 Tax=Puia dinghuensis TaxID=1792502 RepID=A0A8J2UAB0_9BACT|nr:hypothetical protein [Puia dinghuensis]GGA90210.1 hypothetical protein GCM10011511_11830 [Puia dinghuensis]
MGKAKTNDSTKSFSAIEKAKDKAYNETYHFRDSQTGQSSRKEGGAINEKQDSIKITIKK